MNCKFIPVGVCIKYNIYHIKFFHVFKNVHQHSDVEVLWNIIIIILYLLTLIYKFLYLGEILAILSGKCVIYVFVENTFQIRSHIVQN